MVNNWLSGGMGGPGSVAFVLFHGVTSPSTANLKLPNCVTELGVGRRHSNQGKNQYVPAPAYHWAIRNPLQLYL